MRTVSAPVLLGFAVFVATAIQFFRQELSIQELKSHVESASSRVRNYEDGIVQAKLKIQEINGQISPMNVKKAELTKKKVDMGKAEAVALKSINDCQTQKPEAERVMRVAAEELQNSKVQHETDKLKAGEEIQGLKQQISARDQKLCAFVDTKLEQGRKLCGIAVAPK